MHAFAAYFEKYFEKQKHIHKNTVFFLSQEKFERENEICEICEKTLSKTLTAAPANFVEAQILSCRRLGLGGKLDGRSPAS